MNLNVSASAEWQSHKKEVCYMDRTPSTVGFGSELAFRSDSTWQRVLLFGLVHQNYLNLDCFKLANPKLGQVLELLGQIFGHGRAQIHKMLHKTLHKVCGQQHSKVFQRKYLCKYFISLGGGTSSQTVDGCSIVWGRFTI